MSNFQLNIRAIIGISVIFLSFIFLFALLGIKIPAENKDTLNIAIGLVLAAMGGVVGYYFGSSKNESDKAKTDQANLQNPPPQQSITEIKTTEVK